MPARTKEARRKYNRMRRERLKEQGICVTCGWREVMTGRTLCQDCYDRWKSHRQRDDPGNAQLMAYKKAKRAECIAKGICTECKKRPATEGMRMCPRCREMRNDSTKKYRIHQRTLREGLQWQ